ncbi:hypothetical protein DDE05_44500, partial [Streptomyces cavourensis]
DTLTDYAAHLLGLVDLKAIRPLKVVVDAGNGMGGHTVPTVFEGLPLDLVPMYFDLDGTFPNHEANPLDPKNIVDLQARVVAEGADLGLAFDGDADRCFVVDERGEGVSPSAITALVAARELARNGGEGTVIHNLITSWSVPEVVRENGGTAVRTRVGHSFIKTEMAKHGAIFGGEHSAHYYFRDFWNADTGMLAALHVLAALGGQTAPLSELVAQYDRYTGSGDTTAVVVSTNVGILENVCSFADTIARDTVLGLSPLGLPQTSSNVIAGSVALAHGLRGPNVTLCNGPTSGLDALYWARALIVTGRADTAVVIGVEPTGDIVT